MTLGFGDLPAAPSWLRLVVAGVAVVHLLLCLRVIGFRAVGWVRARRAGAERVPVHAERVPTAAMVAYGLLCFHIARILLERIPGGQALDTFGLATYAAALVAGTFAFAQIVYLVRRDRVHKR